MACALPCHVCLAPQAAPALIMGQVGSVVTPAVTVGSADTVTAAAQKAAMLSLFVFTQPSRGEFIYTTVPHWQASLYHSASGRYPDSARDSDSERHGA